MLSLWRRHTKNCKHRNGGRGWTKCSCPVWRDGEVNGRRVRESLDTRDWARAGRKAAVLEGEVESGRVRKTLEAAAAAYLEQRSVEPSTFKKYSRGLRFLSEHARSKGLTYLDEIGLEFLDAHRLSRKLADNSWGVELENLRTFWKFCIKRKWCEDNPAVEMDRPKDPKPAERPPFTAEEISKIIVACDTFGRAPYERLRARAMILLMRYYGLRVSDVATLKRDRIRNGREIFVHALKNGQDIWLPYTRRSALLWTACPCRGVQQMAANIFFGPVLDRERATSKQWTKLSSPSSARVALGTEFRIVSGTHSPPKSW